MLQPPEKRKQRVMLHVAGFDEDKFRELLLYVADKCADDRHFGATKLNKILFFSDSIAYASFGRPITSATYQKLDRGPGPKELLPIQKQLVDNSEAVVVTQKRFQYTQKRLMALRQPALDSFSAAEIALVDEVIQALQGHNAAQVSELSHATASIYGWIL